MPQEQDATDGRRRTARSRAGGGLGIGAGVAIGSTTGLARHHRTPGMSLAVTIGAALGAYRPHCKDLPR